MDKAPYILIFLAACLIYVPRMFVAKAQAEQPEGYDNAHPRDQQARLSDFGKRANGAHQNGFEAFMMFAAGVLGSVLGKVSPNVGLLKHASNVIVGLGSAFIVARCVYIALYLGNKPTARSSVWTLGFLATCGLLLAPAFIGG